jgi:cellulose-binding protein
MKLQQLGILLLLPAAFVQQSQAQGKARVVILTDVGIYSNPDDKKDPDDAQSLVRLLLYSNELDIEGLVATKAAQRLPDGNVISAYPQSILDVIDGYAAVHQNLTQHARGYPTADDLRALVKPGNPVGTVDWGQERDDLRAGIGEGKDSPASEHIIQVVDKEDERPVWFLVFGKVIDLGQALWKVRATRSDAEVDSFASKVRVYDIAGQDNVGSWIAREFPAVYYIRSVRQFRGIDSEIGDQDVFSDAWTAKHIRSHGAYGAKYLYKGGYQEEGDTPSYLYLLPTGLSDPDYPEWGSWGGRFTANKEENVFSRWAPKLDRDAMPFFMFRDVADAWPVEEHLGAPVARWRGAFQHDFAARMDWTVQSNYADANHPPVAGFNDDTSGAVIELTVKPGAEVKLSAEGSTDPDGNNLSYRWYQYREPGSYAGSITISNSDARDAAFKAPPVEDARTIHIVLEVTDDGELSLTRYRRVIVTVDSAEPVNKTWSTRPAAQARQ